MGSNSSDGYASEVQGYARRCDDVPFPEASDHYPIGLRWLESGSRRRRKSSEPCILKRPIPQWLIVNTDFIEEMDAWIDDWFVSRSHGVAGLLSFSGGVHSFASSYLSSHVIVAKTVRHKLDLALSALQLLKQSPINGVGWLGSVPQTRAYESLLS